jgi:hypothetical protein
MVVGSRQICLNSVHSISEKKRGEKENKKEEKKEKYNEG